MSMFVSATMHLYAMLSSQLIDDMNDPELCGYAFCLIHGRWKGAGVKLHRHVPARLADGGAFLAQAAWLVA